MKKLFAIAAIALTLGIAAPQQANATDVVTVNSQTVTLVSPRVTKTVKTFGNRKVIIYREYNDKTGAFMRQWTVIVENGRVINQYNG